MHLRPDAGRTLAVMRFEIRVTDDGAKVKLKQVDHGFPEAVSHGVEEGASLLGQRVTANARDSIGLRQAGKIANSFLQPVQQGPDTFILGRGAPRWAGLHEYGGTIRARRLYLTFEYPKGSGEWHSVKTVTIREKRFVRDSIAFSGPEAADQVGQEIAFLFGT
jgi:hypothetical protein